MASPPTLRCWCFPLALLCLFVTRCKSDQDPVGVAAKAFTCFNDHYIYSSCEESYRLSAEGTINVSPEATDQYCEGPCLVETKLVLQCLDSILYNFQFDNGADVEDVKYALNTGCGHTSKRGDFNVLEGDNGEYCYYDHGNKLGIHMYPMILLGCLLLLWGF